MKKLYFLAIIPLLYLIFSYNNTDYKIIESQNYSNTYSVIPSYMEDYYYYVYYYEKIDDIYENKNLKMSNILINIDYLADYNSNKWQVFKSIVDYAYHKKVFIWIESTTKKNLANEYKFYNDIINLNYTNVGISLASNNKDIHQKIESVLSKNGIVRLVLGHYKGNIKDWEIIRENFRINAERLIESDENKHSLLIEDLELLEYLKSKYLNFNEINLSFNSYYLIKKIENINNNIYIEIYKGNFLSNKFKYFWDLTTYNFLFN
tara:strand:+ start:413 stop:1201 length:789 start_codon:yes stop_codon:yes gene_type:complete